MDLWFSEVHTPDVKLSLRTAKQLYAGATFGESGTLSLQGEWFQLRYLFQNYPHQTGYF